MLTVLLLRHAEAEDREVAAAAGTADADRALTPKGRKTMTRVGRTLAGLIPDLALVASSPLRRAVETAEFLAQAGRDVALLQTHTLAPGLNPHALIAFLAEQSLTAPCALVGHEPDLGLFASWALGGSNRSFIPFKKAGAALLRFPDAPSRGTAELLWLLTPGQLRRLELK